MPLPFSSRFHSALTDIHDSPNSFLGDHTSLPPISPPIQYATVANYTAYPYSRGSIHITDSRSTSLNKLSFDSGFLSHSADVAIQLWAYKKQREIFRRTNAYAGELIFGHPAFPKGSQAALNDGPVEGVKEKGGFRTHGEDGGGVDRKEVRDLEYTTEDDEVIRGFIRENINTTWHSLGTCRMKSREEGGVVSGRLDVHGVTGLKVAGESILSLVPVFSFGRRNVLSFPNSSPSQTRAFSSPTIPLPVPLVLTH